MSLALQRSQWFIADFESQIRWYVRNAGESVAVRYLAGLQRTLQLLARHPDLGRLRHFRNPKLRKLRSCRVQSPFNKHLIFYYYDATTLNAIRVIHGARDLPQRLLEAPENSVR